MIVITETKTNNPRTDRPIATAPPNKVDYGDSTDYELNKHDKVAYPYLDLRFHFYLGKNVSLCQKCIIRDSLCRDGTEAPECTSTFLKINV